MMRSAIRNGLGGALVCLLLLLAAACADATRKTGLLQPPRDVVVRRVIDGDTLVVGERERVRLIGVDAPEIAHRKKDAQPGSEEAKRFVQQRAEGATVLLEFDASAEAIDRYGRTLAYVTLPDGTSLNLEIIQKGYAKAYHWLPYDRKAEFLQAAHEACEARLGLWTGSARCPAFPPPDR